MKELAAHYVEELEYLAGEIQESDQLATYLDTEEDDDYNVLKDLFEPRIADFYAKVALENPLQLIALEQFILLPEFEGLFLPKILGYSVLRGEVNEQGHYARPQDHFRDVLEAICNSSNFEILRKRIGQSIQIGFGLSSDIWITNLINTFENKRIRYYLQSQKLEKYRNEFDRKDSYLRYKKQFVHDNYQTAEFPTKAIDLVALIEPLKQFIIHRIKLQGADNSTILPEITAFVGNKEFFNTVGHLQVLFLYVNFFDLDGEDRDTAEAALNKVRKSMPDFLEHWLKFLLEMTDYGLDVDADADVRTLTALDLKVKDGLSEYYKMLDIVHEDGFRAEAAQEAVKVYYSHHEGMSIQSEAVRQVIRRYFAGAIRNLEVSGYPEYFELTKTFPIYMNIFANQQFNQYLKDLSMTFVNRCLKKFIDKRSKDYQDIKKFVTASFQDWKFMKEKEIVELFKTRRARKKGA
ncbi:MAG: hypothetical protein IPJ40_24150 [Saprospirales bacterium]|nr:hypothetical protein [Saprospirales bacterium]